MKKGEMSVNTIFYILMVIIMVGILIFGYQRIFETQKTISKVDLLGIKDYLEKNFEECSDPLNRGNLKTFEIKHDAFNSICIIKKGDDLSLLSSNSDLVDELDIFEDSLDENEAICVLIDTDFGSSGTLEEFNIIDKFELDYDRSECFFDFANKGLLTIQLKCD